MSELSEDCSSNPAGIISGIDGLVRTSNFPGFVADLAKGVFDVVVDASIQQMEALPREVVMPGRQFTQPTAWTSGSLRRRCQVVMQSSASKACRGAVMAAARRGARVASTVADWWPGLSSSAHLH
jgi:hypothetical protein